eukprot:GGOE01021625.1.p1 GENE.GGOE01021625.1~~GGOE01021625.1.p1  ORF type:complete len:458 (+),score=66.70 GGOE01021625.1:205-1374(+)
MDYPTFECFIHEREEQLQVLFSNFDIEGSGTIDLPKMKEAIKKYNPSVSELDFRNLFNRFHKDADGVITFEEFREALLVLPSIQVATLFDTCNCSAIDIGESVTIPLSEVTREEQRRSFIAGLLAGGISRTVTAPLERLKVVMQTSTTKDVGAFDTVRSIYQEGGLRSFWHGNTAHVLKLAPELGLRFWAFYHVRQMIGKGSTTTTISEQLLAGVIAGIFSQSIVYPMETIKVRMELGTSGQYRGIIDCARQIYLSSGLLAFFRGYVPSMMGIVPYCGVDLAMYSGFKEAYVARFPDDTPGPFVLLTCGTISCFCGQFVAYPFQLLRIRLQASGLAGAPLYQNLTECFRAAVQVRGIPGLYYGVSTNVLKMMPALSVARLVDDWARRTF